MSMMRSTGTGTTWSAPKRGAMATVLLAVSVAAAGCGSGAFSGDSTSSSSATASGTYSAALCSDLTNLGNDLNSLKALDSGSVTLDQIKTLDSQVRTALDQATSDAHGLDSAELATINGAFIAFTDALNALSSSTTGSQAYLSVESQIVALTTAYDAAKLGSHCPSLPGS